MPVRPRTSVGAVDLGDVKAIVEEVAVENESLYDMTYMTMIDAFTEPLEPQEIQDILNRLDVQALMQMVVVDPAGAAQILKEARQANA